MHPTPTYSIIDDILYKKDFSMPFLKCVAPPETTTILRVLHEVYATCHGGVTSIIRKSLNQSYFWPTMN